LEELEKWIEGEAEIPLNVQSISRQVTVEEITDKDKDLFIKAKASVATELAVQEAEQQKKKTFKELVPEYLRLFTSYRQNNWVDWLPIAEFAHNNSVTVTGHSSFKVLYGYNPEFTISPNSISNIPAADE